MTILPNLSPVLPVSVTPVTLCDTACDSKETLAWQGFGHHVTSVTVKMLAYLGPGSRSTKAGRVSRTLSIEHAVLKTASHASHVQPSLMWQGFFGCHFCCLTPSHPS